MVLRVNIPFVLMLVLVSVLVIGGCKQSAGVQEHVAAARARNDGPPIWRVKDADSTLYLYGAVHVLPDGYDWQRPDIDQVFAQAGTVFFEAPRDEAAKAQAEIIAARHGYYTGGRKLTDRLDGYEQKLLFAATLNAGLREGDLHRMEPWLASSTLTNSELTKANIFAKNGADAVLHAQAKAAGKHIDYLETIDDHLMGTATLPLHVQMEGLKAAMKSAGDLAEQTTRLNMEWARGNAAYIEREIVMPLKTDSPEYYAALFTNRNKAWAALLSDDLDKNSGTNLVVAGVGHFVGEDSVIQLLKDKGYEVERYFAYRGENVIKTIDLYE